MSRPRIFSRDDLLRVRLRRSSDPKPKAAKVRVSSITTRGHTVRGTLLRPSPRWHQRVTVKIKYRERYGVGEKADKSFSAALKRQVQYNTRTDSRAKAEGAEPLHAFDANRNRIDAHFAVKDWGSDRRYWKLIISPEHGNDMKDFPGYIREVMAAVERDVLTEPEMKRGLKLEWVGAVHDDTAHKHAHVIMRGRIEDRDLTLNKAYLSHGIRARASEIATKHLGYRTGHDTPSRVTDHDADTVDTTQQQQREASRGNGWGIG